MQLGRLLEVASVLVTLAAAWPGPDGVGEAKALHNIEDLLWRRQDDSTSASASASATKASNSASASAGSTATDKSAAATSDASASASGSQSGSASGTETAKTTGKQSGTKTTGKSESTSFDPRLPAGGISMITPNALSTSKYYKIGDWVTFAWNYTSLSVTPTAIDVLASCSANQGTYTLAVNQSVAPTGKILWDTGAYQSTATLPLLTETYTLIVYDADSSISATSQAGYLAVSDDFTFGMYSPQPYTPLSGYSCATCSGALSSMERQTLGFLAGMASITLLTFTWFAGGVFGVL